MEPVGFTASLVELSGSISGATHEQTPVTSAVAATLPALVSGTRDGASVSFVKTYDGTLNWRHSVRYEGTLSADGSEIEGRWIVTGQWSGWFLMIRATPRGEQAEHKVAEEVRA